MPAISRKGDSLSTGHVYTSFNHFRYIDTHSQSTK